MKYSPFFRLISKSPSSYDRLRSALVGVLAIGVFWCSAGAQPLNVTTFAGQSGLRGFDDGIGSAARFFGPSGLVADSSGGIYVADALNNTIRRISSAGGVTTFAGGNINEITNLPDRGYADGTGRGALFSFGVGETGRSGARTLGLDSAGNLYVADTLNHVIRKLTPAGVVTTLAGSAGNSGSADGAGVAAQFSSPYGVAVDGAGNVYVADAGNNTIRKVTPAGVVSTLAGRDGANSGSTDGSGANARFNNPGGIAADAAGNLYVCDTNNHTVRKVTPAGGVTTLAGSAGARGSSDGLGLNARVNGPTGIAVDGAGNVYVSDTGNGTIRKITPAGVVSTIVGLAGLTGAADGTGNAARLSTPYGVAVDGAGNLFIADSGNHSIRKGVAATAPTVAIQTQPKSQYVNVGANVVLAVAATATPAPTYQWRKNNVNIPAATNASFAISSAAFADEATYAVVVTSGSVSVTSSAAILQVYPSSVIIPPILFLAQPQEQTVSIGQSATFIVDVTGSATPSYQWQREETNIVGATNATFTLASAQLADAGNYRVVVSAGGVTQNSISAGLNVAAAVTPPPPPPPPPPAATGRIINLSILTSLAAGPDNFTMGYVVGGNATTGAKPLVIRAAGPSLGALGVGGTLEDPRLELFAGSTKTVENDNWGGSGQLTAALAAVGAFAYVSPTSKDAAATANITSRDNSVVVSSANSGAGLVIAEIYDATKPDEFVAATPRLINVSVRKHLGTGLTAGFVLGGSASTKVLIRAVGPTLGDFGVPGVVADPQLTLFNGQSVKIGENNDWGGTTALTAAFGSVGAFALPTPSKDAALLVTLPPGNYSVRATGTGTTTGVALVEVYEVP